jgi:hypothetical protein
MFIRDLIIHVIFVMQGKLTKYREALVSFVFQKLNTSHDNELTEQELSAFFKKSAHPDIINGSMRARLGLRLGLGLRLRLASN